MTLWARQSRITNGFTVLPHTKGITFTLLLSPHSSSSCFSNPVQPPFSPTWFHTTSICLSCTWWGDFGVFLDIDAWWNCYLVIYLLLKITFQHLDFCGIWTHSLRIWRRRPNSLHHQAVTLVFYISETNCFLSTSPLIPTHSSLFRKILSANSKK